MPMTVEPIAAKVPPRSVFILRFFSTIALWSVALIIAFSGYELAFQLLSSMFGLVALWEFYRMLDHKGLPNFKVTGMICGALMLAGSFHYFRKMGPAGSYDFEVAVLLFFLLTVFRRQMFARQREENMGRIFWRAEFVTACQPRTFRADAGPLVDVDLDSCHAAWIVARFCRGYRRPGRVDYQTKHWRQRFWQFPAWNRR